MNPEELEASYLGNALTSLLFALILRGKTTKELCEQVLMAEKALNLLKSRPDFMKIAEGMAEQMVPFTEELARK